MGGNYIEMARLSATSTQAVVRELKTMFARFGISEILVTDNGPQFSSNEFQVFARLHYIASLASVKW